jgi:cytochrome c-type biogenesis protein
MHYLISFLEGIITFISPCLLPLLPVFISYFAGGGVKAGADNVMRSALGFVLGFTLVFVALGAFAGLLGGLLYRYATALNIVTGAVVILFGLNYLGAVKIGILNAVRSGGYKSASGFLPAVIFGIVFSLGWTPCVGAFLGSALMLASQQGSAVQGIIMLFCYSLGLGLPFILSAALIERLKSAFDWVKEHYSAINAVSGLFLVVMGILMMTGLMGRVISMLSF